MRDQEAAAAATILGATVRPLEAPTVPRLRELLELDTYHPETGRYGEGSAMAAAERVFAADSTAALTQRHRTPRHATGHTDVDADAVTVASLVELAIAFTGEIHTGMRWLAGLPRQHAPADRARHHAATRLADPTGDWATLRSCVPESDTLLAAWQQRRTALTAYRHTLTPPHPHQVLPSLLHMHHTRMFGPDPERERTNHRLARAAAHRWLTITGTTTVSNNIDAGGGVHG